jgi:hypothetical protein
MWLYNDTVGFMVRVEQSTRNSPNIMELQFEIATKKEAIWRIANVKEWCQKAGVRLQLLTFHLIGCLLWGWQ